MDKLSLKIAGEITLSKNPGASLKKWREIFGVTQTELANYLGVTSSTISDYEANRRKSPGTHIIRRFVKNLIEIDKEKGGWTIKRLREKGDQEEPYEIVDFTTPLSSKKFIEEVLDGEILTNEEKLEESKLYGCTFVDSIKAILELPCDEFINIYGSTTERALIFTHVSMGRSPLVAVRVTELKPSLLVLHNAQEVDGLAIKISEVEKVPLARTILPIEEIKNKIKEKEY